MRCPFMIKKLELNGPAVAEQQHTINLGRILGGFKLSSQHWDEVWCDGGSATFGSGFAGQVGVAGAAGGGAA